MSTSGSQARLLSRAFGQDFLPVCVCVRVCDIERNFPSVWVGGCLDALFYLSASHKHRLVCLVKFMFVVAPTYMYCSFLSGCFVFSSNVSML